MTLSKSEFVDRVASTADVSKSEAQKVVDAVAQVLTDALKAGDEVAWPGLGKFSVSARAARQGRNPATGETIQIAASNAPKFSAASALKQAVNG